VTLYATLNDVQSVMTGEDTAATDAAKNKILSDLRVVSRRVDREFMATRPLFAPVIETRKVPIRSDLVNDYFGTLYISNVGALLALTGVTLGDSALTVGTHVEAWPDSSQPPFTHLRLIEGAPYGWTSYSANITAKPLLAAITGVWGLHRDYANAWVAAGTVSEEQSAGASTLKTVDSDIADVYGVTPRIGVGSLLKINDEYEEVISATLADNPTADTLGVRRAQNGTTAAVHAAGATIYVWRVEEPVRRAVARQAALLYARRGAYTTVEVQGMGEVRYPADWLSEVRATLADYVYGV
jgi:hypothetical protein